MLNRLSVNFSLKSDIASLMTVIVIALAFGALESWRRLGSVNRIAAVADALAPLMPDARVACVPAAGHSVYFERAAEFNKIVDEFLAGNS